MAVEMKQTDAPSNRFCFICDAVETDTDPVTELACKHLAHSRCVGDGCPLCEKRVKPIWDCSQGFQLFQLSLRVRSVLIHHAVLAFASGLTAYGVSSKEFIWLLISLVIFPTADALALLKVSKDPVLAFQKTACTSVSLLSSSMFLGTPAFSCESEICKPQYMAPLLIFAIATFVDRIICSAFNSCDSAPARAPLLG